MFAACLLGGASVRAAVEPDTATAWAFGTALQRDFHERNVAAIVSRIDSDALIARVLLVTPADGEMFADVRKHWSQPLLNAAQQQLQGFAGFSSLIAARVRLCEDTRQLECICLAPDGAAQLLVLSLAREADGEIRISDVQLGWTSLSLSRGVRETLLLLQLPLPRITSEDDATVRELGQVDASIVSNGLKAFGENRLNDAFQFWNGASPDLKRRVLWRSFRDRMAVLGCAAAMRDLQREIAAGNDVDPFVRFTLAKRNNDAEAALTAVNDILRVGDDLAFFRTAKARVLLDLGRASDAYHLASDVTELTPLSGAAYMLAIEAAVTAYQPPVAMKAIRRWSRIVTPAQIDTSLARLPAAGPLRKTPEYQSWIAPPAAPSR